ncbi:MAG: LacI family DNA-binding transcriptional regulator, partial [Chitinophagaceae bacterium]
MKFEAITLKDIAKALGLSTSTVSRALRDSYEINEETKKRVLE